MEHKLILGGEIYLPFARSRIRALRAAGAEYASQQFEIDGVSVKVRIEPGHEYIALSGGGYPILSGAIRGGDIIELPIPEGSPPGTRPVKTLRSYKPTAQALKYPLKAAPAKTPAAFRDEPRLAVQTHPSLGVTDSQNKYLAGSMYSGAMAQAVQLILGYGKVKVRYDYHWRRCHGITKAADDALWLVEISQDRGVLAMPLPTFKGTEKLKTSKQDVISEGSKKFNGLPSGHTFPVDAALNDAITAGNVLQIKSAEDMAAYFSNSPFSEALGWSFNNDGTEAHNTCYRELGGEVTSYHYKLTLQIGGKVKTGRTPNQPLATASADLTIVSQGPLTVDPLFGTALPFDFHVDGYEFDIKFIPRKVFGEFNIDVATTAPLFVCHIDGVLDVVYMDAVPPGGGGSPLYDNVANVYPPYGPYVVTFRENVGGRVARSSRVTTREYTSGIINSTTIDRQYSLKTDSYSRLTIDGNLQWVFSFSATTVLTEYRRSSRNVTRRDKLFWPGRTRDCYGHTDFEDLPSLVTRGGFKYSQEAFDVFGGQGLSDSGGVETIDGVNGLTNQKYLLQFFIVPQRHFEFDGVFDGPGTSLSSTPLVVPATAGDPKATLRIYHDGSGADFSPESTALLNVPDPAETAAVFERQAARALYARSMLGAGVDSTFSTSERSFFRGPLTEPEQSVAGSFYSYIGYV